MARAASPRSPLARGLVISIVVLLTAFVVLELLGWPFMRGPTETFLARQLERPVRITAPFRLHLLGGLGAEARGVWIAAPEGFEQPHVVDAEEVRLRLRYRDLRALRESGALRIAALDVDRLDARLVRRDDGVATWQIGAPRDKPQEEEKDDSPQPPPEVDHLAVREGRIELRDPVIEADLTATFATHEGSADETPGSRVVIEGDYRDHPLEADLTTAGLLRLLARGEEVRPVPAKAHIQYGGVKVEFDGTVSDLFGTREFRGKAAASGESLAVLGELFGMVLPTTAPFSLEGEVNKDKDVWRAVVPDARIGSSRLAGDFAYDATSEPSRLEGTLTGTRLVFADLGPAFGTRDPEGKPVEAPTGRVVPDRPLDLPALRNMDAQVAVDIDHVDLGFLFAEDIAPFRADLSVNAGVMALAEIDARTAKGNLEGEITVDPNEETPLWRGDLRWSGIRLEEWIGASKERIAEAERRGEEPPPPYIAGALHGRAKVTGFGESTAQVLDTLDGEVTMFVREGSISHLVVALIGLDVAQALGLVFTGDRALPTECVVIDMAAAKGQLMPRVGLIDTPVTSILVDGSVDLGEESLDLRLVARPKEISPLSLRSPIHVEGTFVEPRVAPEAGPIAGRVLGGLALGIAAPLAALLPFLDPGQEAESPCARALAHLRS